MNAIKENAAEENRDNFLAEAVTKSTVFDRSRKPMS